MVATEATATKIAVHRRVVKLMGNRFEISVVSDDANWAEQKIDIAIAEIKRIEKLFTTFDEGSQTNIINRNAGIHSVKVDREVYNLVARSLKISELTQGAFDITYGSIDKRFWNFDVSMTSLPDAATAKQTVRLINYRNVILDEKAGTVYLKNKGFLFGFGATTEIYTLSLHDALPTATAPPRCRTST